ncbi:MAG: thermonuclease family protein [Clostridia bacterium]|nr:thermonuclease family protein [Clostridia bacterium]
MYYDSKSSFYMKQYGFPALVIFISVLLIGGGLFIYFASSTKNATEQEMVIASNELKDVDSKSATVLTKELNGLKPLQQSDFGMISEIQDDGKIIFIFDHKLIEFYLLGIDIQNSKGIISNLRADLQSKNVKIAFDQEKVMDSKIYAYVYIDNTLYNETILENGKAILKQDTSNITLISDLKQAQAYAKQLAKGVWKK